MVGDSKKMLNQGGHVHIFVQVIKKNFLKFCKIFEITRTIYSNSERSGQFLVTE